jgi:hypothetical protein
MEHLKVYSTNGKLISNNKQSSLDYLLYYLPSAIRGQFKEQIEQAKAMHKEEVQDAYRISPNNELWSNSGIDYYIETFGGNNE